MKKKMKEMETDERCVEEKCKDAQNIPFTFRLRLCSLPIFHLDHLSFFYARLIPAKVDSKGKGKMSPPTGILQPAFTKSTVKIGRETVDVKARLKRIIKPVP